MNYIKIAVVIILFSLTGTVASAQKLVNVDTLKVSVEKTAHSPRKATIYSAVLPGLGQIYNKKYWKVPLIYIGFGTFGYFINYNNNLYTQYRQAYSDIVDSDPNTNSFVKLNIDNHWNLNDSGQLKQFADRLKNAKETARRNRDLVIISTAAFYTLNIIDASVDANFFDFDMSDDLSFEWIPGPVYCLDQRLVGIHCRIRF